jgi:uncharacterized protein YndB with AHSA1/START domain
LERYERTFRVSASRERVWRAFTDPEDLAYWHGAAECFEPLPGGRVRFADPGYEPVEGVVEEAIAHRLLRWRTGDIVITEVFEAGNGGTQVTITQTSERLLPEHEREAHQRGWDESIADLILLLDSGVGFSRHMTPGSTIGATTKTTPAGVEIVDVVEGQFAAEAGLQAGDLLVKLGAAPIFDRSDVALLTREHPAGTGLEAVYVRDGRLCRGRGRLAPRD